MKATFICCYNNTKELNEMLLPSFKKLGRNDSNLILIDTVKEK